ncbi:MAG: hypothetical protein MJZ58_06950, partial [Paludibacteraceae bacterium]|nr:hypothetical protein [Paludibacteraceae bacterium]
GKEYSEPGFYSDTVCNIASYTSIIYTLNLSLIVPTEIQSATVLTQEICADAHEMVLYVQHTGATPQTFSVYFDARAHHEGFEDIKDASFLTPGVITIPVPEMGVPAYQNHMRYVRPDNYTVTVELNNGVCGVAKSKPVEFQVRYPSWILEQNWSNVVAVLAKDYNGGFEFNQYSWRINNAPMEGTEAYIRNDFLAKGDSVVAYLTRVGEDYSIPTCPLIIAAPAPDAYPTPVLQVEPSSAPVTSPRFVIKSQMGGDYSIYTMMGQPLGQGKFEQGIHELMLPALVGHYVIYVSQEDGTKKAQHVIVY